MGCKKIINGIKVLSLALVFALMPVTGVQAASWGPERPTYTNQKPATSATFNSITDNAAVGDERSFVRIAEVGSGNKLVNALRLEAGKQYVVSIYYHNDASSTTNVLRDASGKPILKDGLEQIGPGVALDVRVVASFPTQLKAGQTGQVTGKIISTNTSPQAVWASADVTAAQDMTITYVENTAKIYNDWAANRRGVSRYLFSDEGAFIGLDDLNGMIFGCDEYSGQVAYVLKTEAVTSTTPKPTPDPDPEPTPDPEPEPTPGPTPDPEPTPDPTPENPTIDPEPEVPSRPTAPDELPETGPVEIILAVVVVGLIIAGVVYWRKTRAEVKKVTKSAKSTKNRKR